MSSKQDNFKLLKLQTVVLKVYIHCVGCQRKVKKKLQKIDGVYTVDVDLEQHKVTVTGEVDAAFLIHTLKSAGKHAELWPASGKGNNNVPKKQQNELKVHFDLKEDIDLKPHKGNKDGGEGFDGSKEKKDKPNGTYANKEGGGKKDNGGGGGGKKGGVGATDAQNKAVGNGASDGKQNNGSAGGTTDGAKNNGSVKKGGNQVQNPGKKPDGEENKGKNGGGGKNGEDNKGKNGGGGKNGADNQSGEAGGGEGNKSGGGGNANTTNGNSNGGGKKAGKKGNAGDSEASSNVNGPVPGFNNPMHGNGVPGFHNPMHGNGGYGNGCGCHCGHPGYDYRYNMPLGYGQNYHQMGNSSSNDAAHFFSDENTDGCSIM